jgi:benzoyl-CoA reductase/2-hydroxyglutaryl-CoA dehydratase subunit BcrC/BadD/HgdB
MLRYRGTKIKEVVAFRALVLMNKSCEPYNVNRRFLASQIKMADIKYLEPEFY